jgi:hypothetical protein
MEGSMTSLNHTSGITALFLSGSLCTLMLAPVVPAFAAPSERGMGYTNCYDPKSTEFIPPDIACDKLPPEELARQRAYTDDLNRRYDEEQKVLIPPTTKPDLTLVCDGGYERERDATVQIWFGANVLTWGIGRYSEAWRLTKVLQNEIAFGHIFQLENGPSDASGHINRVTGTYARDVPYGGMGNAPMGTNTGVCNPAAPKF